MSRSGQAKYRPPFVLGSKAACMASASGRIGSTCGIDGELADRDIDAPDAPVADAEDGLGVGGDNEVHLASRQSRIAQGGLDLAGRIDAEIDAGTGRADSTALPTEVAEGRLGVGSSGGADQADQSPVPGRLEHPQVPGPGHQVVDLRQVDPASAEAISQTALSRY